MSNHERYQFRLRTAFALMLGAAVVFMFQRKQGILLSLYGVGLVSHLVLMIRLNRTPRPWNEARTKVVQFGWFMLVPYVPVVCLWVMMVSFTRGTTELFLPIVGLSLLATPLTWYCFLRIRHLFMDAFAPDDPLDRPLRWTSAILALGPFYMVVGGVVLLIVEMLLSF